MVKPTVPHLRRIPGSAILAVVFLWIIAAFNLLGSLIFLSATPLLGVILFAGAAFAAVLAVGIVKRKRWCRIAGIVWSSLMTAFWFFEAMRTTPSPPTEPTANYSGLLAVWALLLLFLCLRNTRLWVDNGARPHSSSFLSVDGLTPQGEVFTVQDRVEVVEDVAGLEAGAIGTVIDVPDDPTVVVVAFDDHEDLEPVQITLRTNEIRLVDEPESGSRPEPGTA